jgi:hypothetical protein
LLALNWKGAAEMKLVEILARELSEWPEDYVSCIVQDPGAALYVKYGEDRAPLFSDGQWMNVWCESQVSCLVSLELATDHATAIVTREMWEAGRARVVIDAIVKDSVGVIADAVVAGCYDNALGLSVSYNPISDRDRIRAIDAKLKDLAEERAERIAELAAEGFALLPVVDAVEPAGDMADWRNWEAGDWVERVGESSSFYTQGRLYLVFASIKNRVSLEDDCAGEHNWDNDKAIAKNFKFHSRPKPC